MTTVSTGLKAEARAANYLQSCGYQVEAKNWRTRYCEIDIIAKRSGVTYFVEVKYRRSSLQGTGLDYITAKKLQQMRFAAEMWVSQKQWQGAYELLAFEISGVEFNRGRLAIL